MPDLTCTPLNEENLCELPYKFKLVEQLRKELALLVVEVGIQLFLAIPENKYHLSVFAIRITFHKVKIELSSSRDVIAADPTAAKGHLPYDGSILSGDVGELAGGEGCARASLVILGQLLE